MATDTSLLMGEVVESPSTEERDVEHLLFGFLISLIEEQKMFSIANSKSEPGCGSKGGDIK